jgi:hypothetical protein
MSNSTAPHSCPKCGGTTIDRVRRNLFQRFVLRRRRPYRCVECQHQFLDAPSGEAEAYFAPTRKQESPMRKKAS